MNFSNNFRYVRNSLYCLPWKILKKTNLYEDSYLPIQFVSEDANWAIKNVGENMITTMSDILEQWFQKYQEEISDNKQKVFQNLIDDYNDGNLEERFNEEFKLFLMNYSDEIKKYIADKISIEIDKGLDMIVNE